MKTDHATNKSPRRVLLKLSGESFCRPGSFGVEHEPLHAIAREVAQAAAAGGQVAVVVGGGNIIRGAELAAAGDIHRATADHLGMLGTMINAIALTETLGVLGTAASAFSAVGVPGMIAGFDRLAALDALRAGRVVVLGGGTGNPFFTTDSCAALRAAQLDCHEVLKATKVDGVYDSDPKKNPAAKRFTTLSAAEAIERDLKIMDTAALAICRDAKIGIRVFRFDDPGSITRVVRGEPVGTLITP